MPTSKERVRRMLGSEPLPEEMQFYDLEKFLKTLTGTLVDAVQKTREMNVQQQAEMTKLIAPLLSLTEQLKQPLRVPFDSSSIAQSVGQLQKTMSQPSFLQVPKLIDSMNEVGRKVESLVPYLEKKDKDKTTSAFLKELKEIMKEFKKNEIIVAGGSGPRPQQMVKLLKTVTGTTNATTTIIAGIAGRRIKVNGYLVETASSSGVTITFKDGAGGTALWTVTLQAISSTLFGANLVVPAPSFLFASSPGNGIEMSFSSGQNVVYNLVYNDEDES